jgi:hypothetical protein
MCKLTGGRTNWQLAWFYRKIALKESRQTASLPYIFGGVVHVALRRPERMKINHKETKNTKKEQEKTFVLFVASWLIL